MAVLYFLTEWPEIQFVLNIAFSKPLETYLISANPKIGQNGPNIPITPIITN